MFLFVVLQRLSRNEFCRCTTLIVALKILKLNHVRVILKQLILPQDQISKRKRGNVITEFAIDYACV